MSVPTTFRLAGVKCLLTYPKFKADKQELHMFINQKLKQEATVKICHEHHADGEIHTHACVLVRKKMDIKNSRFFDFQDHHCNITPPKSIEHWRNQVKYMDKEDPEVYGEITVAKDKDEEFAEACEYVKQCKTRKEMYSIGPYLRIISSKVSFFENYWKTQHTKKSSKAQFIQSKLPLISDWTTSWLIHGAAGTGKTQFALSHFLNPLMVSHIDDLHDFDPEEHDGIIFDDMSFKHMPGDAIIHLLDIDHDRSIHCRFFNAEIPAHTKKIFVHNDYDIFTPAKEITFDQQAGIQRRLKTIHITGRLF